MSTKFLTASFSLGTFVWAAIFCLGMFACTSAFGESAVWGTIGFTKHAEPSRGCSVNPGVFRMWSSGNWRGYLGAHQKSDCDIGGVTGLAWLPLKFGRYSVGGTAMLLTDYGPPVFPAAAPAISYDPSKRYGADFIWIPGVIAHLRWRWSFE